MKILITGTSQGIGKAIAELFLANQHTVIGIDRRQASIVDARYTHIVADICYIDIAYTKNAALRVAKYGATCNSLDPGGVVTPLNSCVMDDPALWQEIMDQTPLKRWATAEEIAQWAYFLTVTNGFCTGQSIVVDGGESILSHFVWPES